MLPAILDSLDGLADPIKAEYKQRDDGKFVLDVGPVGGFALEDITGLKSTVQTLRTETINLKANLKKFEGLDPEAAKGALDKIKEWGDIDPDKKAADLLRVKEEQLSKKFKESEQKIVGERDSAIKQLDHHLRVAALTQEIAKKKGNAELLLPHVLTQTRLRNSDKGHIVEVVDAEGNSRISPVGNSTDPMTIPQLIDEMATKFPSAFESSGATGGGAAGGKPASKGTGPVRTIKAGEVRSTGTRLEDIASGAVQVR